MELDYTVIYSAKRKKLTITVERDRSVVVRAPEGTDPEKIRQAVESKRQWLFEKTRHPQKYTDLPHPPGKELVNGESVLYLGRHYRIELVDEGEEIEFAQKFFIPKKLAGTKRAAFQAWYKQQAATKILPRVPGHARSLGVTYNQAKIMDSQYQWGSCTPKDNVNFNWRLIKAPMFVIDYVIVHELAHLLEANHSPRLWNIIRAQIADVDKAKAWLKENGALLELDI
jgi:hypothetical protein